LGGGCAGHLLSLPVNVSAPGKIILFGEHAVVYNRPALAVPVTQVHADVEVLDSPRKGVWINAPGIDLHADLNSLPAGHPIGSVILKLFSPPFSSPHYLEEKMGGQRGLEISIASTIPVAAGLGSGAAVSVALIRALALHLAHPLTDEQVNSLAYEIEKLHHGTPSGIDNTVITYAKPVYFVKGKPMETFKVGKPFTIVIGDTGIPAPTKESVGDVRRLRMRDQHNIENIFNEISQIVLIGRRSIESGMPELLGELMDQNHAYLQALTVSSPRLDKLVEAARNAGALGAKLSGGGRGGNMIALVDQAKAEAIAGALLSAGAKRTIITEIK
jgi:mevalonate kinase